MFYLEVLAQEAIPIRNATTGVSDPKILVDQHPDAVTRWIRLKQMYVNLRGGTLGVNKKVVPRTTNADVLQLAAMWSRELAKVSPRDSHDRSDHGRWGACMDTVKRTADPRRPDAVFTGNEEFWQKCSRRLAIYLMARKAVPSRWKLLKDSVVETIAGVPGTLGKATRTAGGLVTDAAGGVANIVSKPAQAALAVVGAAILLPPIIRAVRK